MAAILINKYDKILHFGVQLKNLEPYNKIYKVKFILNVINGIFCSTIFFVSPFVFELDVKMRNFSISVNQNGRHFVSWANFVFW